MGQEEQSCWQTSRQPSLYGDARRALYVELPLERPLEQHLVEYVGKLERAMHGTRDAPMIWQDHLRKTLIDKRVQGVCDSSWSVST